MNFFQSCVPFGSQRITCSAPMIAMTNDFGLRFKVEQTISPPGFSNCWQAVKNPFGSDTCSTTSMFNTTSNCSPVAARSSAVVWR